MWRRIRRILRPLVARGKVERELADELAFHIEMEKQARLQEGMSEAESHRAAHVAFGGVERYKEQVRQTRRVAWLDDLLSDMRHSVRSIVRYRGFSAAVIATLGLGIGGTTAIFSVVDGLFLRTPDGVREADGLRRVYIVRDEGYVTTPEGGPGSYLDFEALRAVRGFAGVSVYLPRQVDVGRGSEAEQVRAAAVSAAHFDVLGVRAALGRFFSVEEDDVPGAHPVAVISHSLWRREYGGTRDVLDRTLLVNGQPLSIIGVAERGFAGITADPIDIWVPAAMAGPLEIFGFGANTDWRTMPGMAAVDYVVRLAPGATVENAAAEAATALGHVAEAHEGLDPTPAVKLMELTAASGPTQNPAARLSLWLALVAAVVLTMACVNVGSLLLARSVARRRELAVRLALGAGRGRIVRQSLTESVILALFGGVAGLLVTYWGSGIMQQFPLPPWAGRIDLRLLAFTFAISVATGLLFGVAPAVRSVRIDPLRGMQDTRTTPQPGHTRMRHVLVGAQVAMSVVLLVGAALFMRSLYAVRAIEPGVALDQLLLVNADLAKAGFAGPDREEFWRAATARVHALPNVEDAAMIHFAPFVGMSYGAPFRARDGDTPEFDRGPQFNMAGPGYFAAAGVPLLEGREFAESDRTADPVIIVNRAFARALAADGRAVGMCLQVGAQVETDGCSRIVGVVENYRTALLEEARMPMLFMARDQGPDAISWGGPSLLVRVRGDAERNAAAVQNAIRGLHGNLPFINVRPMTELVRRDLLPFRLGATLFTLFGLLALVLAAVGIYGVLGYYVSQRRHEIGIRRSLGAPAATVMRLVLMQGLVPVMAGLAVGLALAVAGTRFIRALLFGVAPTDTLSIAAAVLFLLGTALVATLLPARRAAAIDPMEALRSE